MPTIAVPLDQLVEVCLALRDVPELRFAFLADLVPVDYLPREPRFEISYLLASLGTGDYGETPKRLRVNGTAVVSAEDPLLAEIPGAVFIVRLTAERIFPNCPRYIHKMQLVEESVYAPRPDYTPPVPAWKTFDVFKDALPPRDRSPPTDRDAPPERA